MSKKTRIGYFIVLDSETVDQACEKHFRGVGYNTIENAKKDAADVAEEGQSFKIIDPNEEVVGMYVLKNGLAAEIPWGKS